jgi:outer membrane protein assembly factor BamE (lipoprotein component of BamABCDE complex)
MRTLAGILAATALLAGCASYDGRNLVPGQATSAEVTALMGTPSLELKGPGGERLLYFSRLDRGPAMFVATIGPDDRLRRGIEQRMTYENIYSIKAGMRDEEVRRLLGPPLTISRLPRQQRNVWEYPWRHAVRELRVMWVQFSDDGIVREVVEMHDHQRDPENSFGGK